MKTQMRTILRQFLPVSARRWLVRTFRYPYGGKVDLGDLGRTQPISRVWGLDRGMPVDRYYIERFLSSRAEDIHGHTLEIGENTYSLRYGGSRIQKSDVLHVAEGTPNATIIADLTDAPNIADDTFDAVICTQTLQLIYEIDRAVATLARILKPGGVLLATLPGISQISRYDMDRWGDYWRFTSASAQRLFAAAFGSEAVSLQVYGNVLAATAFLQGLAVEDLNPRDLDTVDADYQMLIGVRAQKR